jgi:hypothetical protein
MDMQRQSEEDDSFFDPIIFGDESNIHIRGKVNEQKNSYMGNGKLERNGRLFTEG